MTNSFQIVPLNVSEFAHLFELEDKELERLNIRRMFADSKPGFPCRVSLEDVGIGGEVLLLQYEHHPANSPYRASGPIFVGKNSTPAKYESNEVPEMLLHRQLSVRAYDNLGLMVCSEVIEGKDLEQMIDRIFSDPKVEYLHIHNAKPGCFNCEVRRAGKISS